MAQLVEQTINFVCQFNLLKDFEWYIPKKQQKTKKWGKIQRHPQTSCVQLCQAANQNTSPRYFATNLTVPRAENTMGYQVEPLGLHSYLDFMIDPAEYHKSKESNIQLTNLLHKVHCNSVENSHQQERPVKDHIRVIDVADGRTGLGTIRKPPRESSPNEKLLETVKRLHTNNRYLQKIQAYEQSSSVRVRQPTSQEMSRLTES